MDTTTTSALFEVVELDPPSFQGGPSERAQAAAHEFADRLAPGESDRSSAVIHDPEARRWVAASIGILEKTFPHELAYLEATAATLGTTVDVLFASQHRSLFPSIAGLPPDDDGCSVGAARLPEGGAWIVKNRDNHPDIRRRHIVARHIDPGWQGSEVIATSSAGGPMAASGGINSHGFCVVSTAIIVDRPPPGIHRTVLMGGLLATCTSVDEALEILAAIPQLGGTLTMGDATGAIATVELEPDAILIERPGSRPWVSRTNHTCSRSVAGGTERASEAQRRNSALRLSRMHEIMSELGGLDQDWATIEPWIATRMSDHEGEDAVCRHEGTSTTISTTIFTCDPPSMLTSIGPGCEGRWGRWTYAPPERRTSHPE
jgi:hypothetical protein